MKEVKYYACEQCNTVYRTKTEAIECEENHKIKATIQGFDCRAFKNGYPTTVFIKFDDGVAVTYKR